MVMNADFGATQAREKALCHVRAGAVERVGDLVVDPHYWEFRTELAPVVGFIGVDGGARDHYLANQWNALAFVLHHIGQRAAFALANGDDHLALTRLVFDYPAVFAICPLVLRFDVAAEVSAIDLNHAVKLADVVCEAQRFPQFVAHHEAGL